MDETDDRIIRYGQLKTELGIPYSRTHMDRLEAEGRWPKRFKLSEGSNYFGWWRREIVGHLSKLAFRREGGEAA
jgi:predicted DNA-binding transcriptional regulator AlpA